MATVVLIHAPEDGAPARALADKLRQVRLNVVLGMPAGPELRQALTGAPVTLALWSPAALRNSAIVDDVTYARAASKVVHACMQNVQAPELFAGEPTINLTGWRGQDDFGPWRELAALVTREAGVEAPPPPRPRAASGFFQPGRVAADAEAAPQQRSASVHPFPSAPAPRNEATPLASQPAPPPQDPPQVFAYANSSDWRSAAANHPRRDHEPPLPLDSSDSGRGATFIAMAVITLGLIGGGGIWFLTQQSSSATAAAWEAVDQSSPQSLRAFMESHQGSYFERAESAYEALEESRYEDARRADTVEALQAFVEDFPGSSRFGLSARGRIAELRSAPASAAAPEDALPPGEEAAPVDPDLVPPGLLEDAPQAAPVNGNNNNASGPVSLGAPEPEPAPNSAPVDLNAPIRTN